MSNGACYLTLVTWYVLLDTCYQTLVTWHLWPDTCCYQIPQNWHLITDIYYLVPLQDRYILPDTWNNQILNMWYSLPLPKRRFQYLIPETSQACYLTHDFKAKARFLDICTESQDTGQNMSNFAGLVWKTDSLHIFGNIMRLAAYFLKPICLKYICSICEIFPKYTWDIPVIDFRHTRDIAGKYLIYTKYIPEIY